MAAHIKSVASSGIRQVTKGEFYELIRPGDLVFCWGEEAISETIEDLTDGPSHVLKAWSAGTWSSQWLTLESTIQKGVHSGLLADYVDGYPGDIVLARRSVLTEAMIFAELNAGFALLDDNYDWQQEVSIAARKLIAQLPLIESRNELYCSGLQYVISLATPHPLGRPAANYPTPEDNWTDPTVEPICAIVRGAK